ncbi:MAG: hypothetical protein JXB62_20245 [Pirellulales bacterium]|nr:hypothetical protein [Pirellulales bacterium]
MSTRQDTLALAIASNILPTSSESTMTRLMANRHHGPVQTRGICDTEAATITTTHATEVFVRCAPIASGTSRNGCQIQSRVVYESLAHLLSEVGADLSHVVFEKAFFRNLAADIEDFEQIRVEAYRKRGITGQLLPAITHVQQPPCRSGQDIELQAFAVLPTPEGEARVRALSDAAEHLTVKLVEIGEARHLYIGNVPGYRGEEPEPGPFCQQSDRMFETADRLLREHGTSFVDVLRTWIYLDDIDGQYDELNAARNVFFQRQGVRRLPASTGIGGGTHPPGNRCVMDLYALLNPEIAQIEVMQTPTLNEAPEYGSAFSRGMKMALPEETYLFVSGTASVDEQGATVHTGDSRGQIERMLLNIEQLLAPHGAGWADLVQAVTFLKSADDLGLFREICAERGMAEAPNTIVQADVCRPDLLCEMEAIAVVPTSE